MNKTLVTLGIGIWGVMLILNFILRGTLGAQLSCQAFDTTLLTLTVIEIFAFILAVVGLFKNS